MFDFAFLFEVYLPSFLVVLDVLLLFVNYLLFFLVNNGLMDLVHMSLVDHWLVDFMDHWLMVLVDNILMVLRNDILVVLMNDVLVVLFDNGGLYILLDNRCLFMGLNLSLGGLFDDLWRLSMLENSSAFIDPIHSGLCLSVQTNTLIRELAAVSALNLTGLAQSGSIVKSGFREVLGSLA
jgi:hypothetical protein